MYEEALANLERELDKAKSAEFLDQGFIDAIDKAVRAFYECLEKERTEAQLAISSIKIPRINLGILLSYLD